MAFRIGLVFLLTLFSFQNCSDFNLTKSQNAPSGGNDSAGGNSVSLNIAFVFANLNAPDTSYVKALDLETNNVVTTTLQNNTGLSFCGSSAQSSSIGDMDGDENGELYVEMCGMGSDFIVNPKLGTSKAVQFPKMWFWRSASPFVDLQNQKVFFAGQNSDLAKVTYDSVTDTYSSSLITLPAGFNLYYVTQTRDSANDPDAIPDILVYGCGGGDCELSGYLVRVISSSTLQVVESSTSTEPLSLPMVSSPSFMANRSLYADVNGDGLQDYVWLDIDNLRVDFHIAGGSNTFKTFQDIAGASSSAAFSVDIGDYNSDGADDFALILGSSGFVYSYSTDSILKTFSVPTQGVPAGYSLSTISTY